MKEMFEKKIKWKRLQKTMVLGQRVEPLNSKESSERGAVPVSMLHHTSPELARESSYHKTAAGNLAQMQHRG